LTLHGKERFNERFKVHFFLWPKGQSCSYIDQVAQQRDATHNIQISDLDVETCVDWDQLDPTDGHMFKGRSMKDAVDPQLLKTWLRMSASVLERSSPPPVRTRFIDLETSSVIEGTTERSFTALSYVWGNAKQLCLDTRTKLALTAPGGLEVFRAELPRTISDAIVVCKTVGERFLWVDALCVQQDDLQDKQSQIAAMGLIYGAASFTIVQASSDPSTDASHPLSGVLPQSRSVRQLREVIQGTHILLTYRPPLFGALLKSKWLTRAWTLQEQYLSRRLLYFTDSQVFMTSDKSHFFCEDTVFEHSQPSRILGYCPAFPEVLEYDWDFNPFDKAMFSSDAERLFFLITNYTARNVRPEDTLNAITALLKRFEQKFGVALWGAPGRVFDYALCWSSVGPATRRRPSFPSWSWLGWEAPVSFVDNLDPFRVRDGLTLAGTPSIRDFEGACMVDPQTDAYSSLRRKHAGTQVGPRAATPSEISDYHRRVLGHERTRSIDENTISSDGGGDGRFLYFRTTAKMLRVGSAEDKPPSGRETSASDGWFEVTCPGSPHFRTRKVSVNRSWRESQPDDLDIDFLAIGIRKVAATGVHGMEGERDLYLLPVRWVTELMSEGSSICHPVANRIAEVSILWPSNVMRSTSAETFDTWMALTPKPVEKFVVLG
jgi:hypothetical protein